MKNILLTVGGTIITGMAGFAVFLVVANMYTTYVGEKEEKRKEESEKFAYICETLRRIEFDVTKINAKINK